jgi:outer membrane protein TolC
MRAALSLIALALLAGCAQVGPPPVAPQPLAVKAVETPAVLLPLRSSPALDALLQRAAQQHPDAQAASARLAQARALLQAQAASERPQASLSSGVERQQQARRQPGSAERLEGSRGFTRHAVEVQGGWELDLFGRHAASRAQLTAQIEAAQQDERQALQQLRLALREQYLQLALLDAQQPPLQALQRLAQHQLAQVERLLDAGLATAQQRDDARWQLRQADEQAAQHALRRTQQAALLALLSGDAQQAPLDATDAAFLDQPLPLLVDAPARVIERQSEVQAAWQRWQAGTQAVERARLERFPSLQLSTAGGFVSDSLRTYP